MALLDADSNQLETKQTCIDQTPGNQGKTVYFDFDTGKSVYLIYVNVRVHVMYVYVRMYMSIPLIYECIAVYILELLYLHVCNPKYAMHVICGMRLCVCIFCLHLRCLYPHTQTSSRVTVPFLYGSTDSSPSYVQVEMGIDSCAGKAGDRFGLAGINIYREYNESELFLQVGLIYQCSGIRDGYFI